MEKTKIITLANQKGGVGKTTSTLAMASFMGQMGKRVLLIDLDAQGNATLASGVDSEDNYNIVDLLKNEVTIEETIIKCKYYDIIPSSKLLNNYEKELQNTMRREYRLDSLFKEIDCYDYIIIDTPPQLSLLTLNAFTCSDDVVIPVSADTFSLQGVLQVIDTINDVKKYLNEKINIDGILIVKFDKRTYLAQDVKKMFEDIASIEDTKVYATQIRETVRLRESQMLQKAICDYPDMTAAIDYKEFLNEYLLNK